MQIHGLTSQQVELCDILWDCSTEQEIEQFIKTIPTEGWKREARNMRVMLLAAMCDDQVNSYDDCGLADTVLARFKK